jgi:hypothetical protein
MTHQRLILSFKPEGVEVRALYRKKDGPGPNTKPAGRRLRSSPGVAYRTP